MQARKVFFGILSGVLFGLGLVIFPPNADAQAVSGGLVNLWKGIWQPCNTLATDNAGNVYVTGTTEGFSKTTAQMALDRNVEQSQVRSDITTMKYNAGGALEWVRRFNGPGNGDDIGMAIAVDAAGNVYVAGSTYDPMSGVDFVTIKYDAHGGLQWTRQYNGYGKGTDYPTAMVVDAQGNVYVTGPSWYKGGPPKSSSPNYDYMTIKYDTNGQELWARRYDSHHYADFPTAIAVDAIGNVLVTGSACSEVELDGSEYRGYATIKYDADGTEQWEQLWGWNGDWPHAVATDRNGNVYVVGSAVDHFYDFMILKYNAEGVLQWNATFDHGQYDHLYAVRVDEAGNVYATGGQSHFPNGFTTVKYDTDGRQIWRNDYGTSESAVAYGLVLDGSGNVYAAGNANGHFALVKYDATGQMAWAKQYLSDSINGVHAIGVSASGAIALMGGLKNSSSALGDYGIVKCDADGNSVWTQRYSVTRGSDAQAVAKDRNGNTYVTGYVYNALGGRDYLTVKYGKNGARLWEKRFDGSSGGDDVGCALAVDDRSGKITVTGKSQSGSSYDIVTLQYDTDGNLLWTSSFDGGTSAYDAPVALKIDGKGSIYLTGISRRSESLRNYDILTIRLSAAGKQLWSRRQGVRSLNVPTGLALDGSGNVYVTGAALDGSSLFQYITVKYSPQGKKLWVRNYKSSTPMDDVAEDIALDGSGNAYVTGRSYSSAAGRGGWDYATIKYDSGGNEQWVRRYDRGRDDRAYRIAVDEGGTATVSGVSFGGGRYSYATVAYDMNGDVLWSRGYTPPGSAQDVCGLELDAAGNLCMTGHSFSDSGWDYLTVKYDSTGRMLWKKRFGGSSRADYARGLALDASGNVLVAGTSQTTDGALSYTTVQYDSNGNTSWKNRLPFNAAPGL